MPNRPGNDDRMMGRRAESATVADSATRSSDNARQNGSQGNGGSGQPRARSNRGFASMDREQAARDREQGRKGGAREGHRPRIRLGRSP